MSVCLSGMPRGPKVGRGVLTRDEVRALNREIESGGLALGRAASDPKIETWVRDRSPELYAAWCDAVPRSPARQKYIGRKRPSPSEFSARAKARVEQRAMDHEIRGVLCGVELTKERPVETLYVKGESSPDSDPAESWLLGPWGMVARWGSVGAFAVALGLAVLSPISLVVAAAPLTFALYLWPKWQARREELAAEPVSVRPRPDFRNGAIAVEIRLRSGRVLTANPLPKPVESRVGV